MKPYQINVPIKINGSFNEVQDEFVRIMSEVTGQAVYFDLTLDGKLTVVFEDKNKHNSGCDEVKLSDMDESSSIRE